MASTPLTPDALASVSAALICTDHDGVDYDLVARHCPLVVDTRNATRSLADRQRIVKA